MDSKKKKTGRWIKAVPLAAMATCIAAFFWMGRSLTHQNLADWLPQNRMLAALAIVALYTVKSLTVFFPLVTLYLLAGIIFPLPIALLVNVLGLIACDTLPYLAGRSFGSEFLDRIRAKYPKLELLETLRQKGAFQFAALTRAAGILPGDVVSIYFGCVRLNYPAYLAGSMLGLAPGMIATTILGTKITNPASPAFWIAAGAGAAVAVLSFLSCKRILRGNV